MRRNYCANCNTNVERAAFDWALRAVCPQCSTALSIIETEMKMRLTIEQSIVLLALGFVGYKVVKGLLGKS